MARKPQTNANIGEVKMANDEPLSNPVEVAKSESHLVVMEKNGETIHVHPNNIADHESLNWVKVAK